MQLGDLSNPELRMLTDQLEKIRFGGDEATVRRISRSPAGHRALDDLRGINDGSSVPRNSHLDGAQQTDLHHKATGS